LNFKSPIFVGDELIVHVRVMELRDDKPVATLERQSVIQIAM